MSSINGGARTAVQFNSNQVSVQNQIESKQSTLKSLQARLADLHQTLASIVDGPAPDPKNKSAYAAWQQKCAQNDAQRNRLRREISRTERDINRVEGELQQLNSVALPSAQAKDRREMDNHLEREKKAQEQQTQAMTGASAGQEREAERAAARTAEKKKSEIVRDDIQRTRTPRSPTSKPPSGSGVPPVDMP